jgi:hypothetical protein
LQKELKKSQKKLWQQRHIIGFDSRHKGGGVQETMLTKAFRKAFTRHIKGCKRVNNPDELL